MSAGWTRLTVLTVATAKPVTQPRVDGWIALFGVADSGRAQHREIEARLGRSRLLPVVYLVWVRRADALPPLSPVRGHQAAKAGLVVELLVIRFGCRQLLLRLPDPLLPSFACFGLRAVLERRLVEGFQEDAGAL